MNGKDSCRVVLPTPTFTNDELKRFLHLRDGTASNNGAVRVESRLALQRFTNEHGERTCEAMKAEAKRRGLWKE
jgi:hypothetical protein